MSSLFARNQSTSTSDRGIFVAATWYSDIALSNFFHKKIHIYSPCRYCFSASHVHIPLTLEIGAHDSHRAREGKLCRGGDHWCCLRIVLAHISIIISSIMSECWPGCDVRCVVSCSDWPGQQHPHSEPEALLSWMELSCNVVCWLLTVCAIVWERGRTWEPCIQSPLPETRLNERTDDSEQFFLANWPTRTESRKKNHEIHH